MGIPNPVSAIGGAVGGKGSGAPTPPDFSKAAQQQAASGHINQSGPFGSTSWQQGPDGQWSQNTQLAGGLQTGANNLENQIAHQGPLDNGTAARDQAIQATYGQMASRLDPQWAQRDESFRQQMANQGLDPGSEAYNNAYGNLSRERNDAYQGAMNNAVQQGLGAQQLTFNQNLAAQNNPYQQLSMLHGLTSGLSGVGPQTQFLPAASMAYQGANQKYSADQAAKNSGMAGLGNLAGTAAMFL